jgi:hypothetical protein
MHSPGVKGKRADHAIAIKPVTIRRLTNSLAAWTVPKKSALQVIRQITVNLINPVIMFFIEILETAMTGWKPIIPRNCIHRILLFITFRNV